MSKMSPASRIIIAIASVGLIAAFFFPIWFIFLIAPQYPEGLTMNIWLDKITGQVEIINGLNHYIGMKHIKAEMFPEFAFMKYIVWFFIAFGLVVAITGKRKLLFGFLILTVLGGIAAMYDFYKWGYDYGHNLDPKAAIQIPGLSYQPPLFGHKTLLNFDAYSYPDIGGWIVIALASVFFVVWFFEWRKNRKSKVSATTANKSAISSVAVGIVFFLTSCQSNPQPFAYGKDICDECKMTIMDPKFGGQVITKKGKVYKFDDAHCMVNFLKKGNVKQDEIGKAIFINYEKQNDFLDIKSASFVTSEELKSPMNSNTAAFASEPEAIKKAQSVNGAVKNWDQLYQAL